MLFTHNEIEMHSHQQEEVNLGFHIFLQVREDHCPIPCQEQEPLAFPSKHHRLQQPHRHRLIQGLSQLEFLDRDLGESNYL
jgi:hypothetical protein